MPGHALGTAGPWMGLCLLLLSVAASHAAPSNGTPICTALGVQGGPEMASDGAGGAILTWMDFRNSDVLIAPDIYAQRLTASGSTAWPPNGSEVVQSVGEQSHQQIISDGAGGAIIVWHDRRMGTFDIYAQRLDPLGTPMWPLPGVVVCDAAGDQANPQLTSDGGNGAIIAWDDYRNGHSDIFARRITASGGLSWAANGVVLCMAPYDQNFPHLVSDGAGGAIVAWQDRRNGLATDVYVRRIGSSGTPMWASDGVALSALSGEDYHQRLVSDGAGGAIITWFDSRSTFGGIRVGRVNGTGALLWPANGVRIAPGSSPEVVTDGVGGAIITWMGGGGAILAQRVNASGSVLWSPGTGVAACTEAGDGLEPRIASDEASGAVISWHDGRSGVGYDVYAQRVSAAGVPLWASDGIAVSVMPGAQYYTQIVSDGAGGALIGWADQRDEGDTQSDVYAAHVSAGIAVDVGDPPLGTALTVQPNVPNPFRNETALRIQLAAPSEVVLEIFDVSKRRLLQRPLGFLAAGPSTIRFEARDGGGRALPSGVYFYRVTARNERRTGRMVIAR
jgi:hypothetical protein